MRAMSQAAYGKPSLLQVVDVAIPAPGPEQVRVRVVAGSVNPVDWKRMGGEHRVIMPVKFPAIPGYDVSGVIDAVGSGAAAFKPGQRVHARIADAAGGGAAEYALVGLHELVAMPDGLGFADAAALPLAGMTALQALRDQARVPLTGASQRVLVVGASGGVGHFAVQIARAAGATVVGVCSARNAELVRSLGAEAVVDYAKPDAYAGQAPFDVVLDCVAGDYGSHLPHLVAGGVYVSTMPSPGTIARSLFNAMSSKKVRYILLKTNAPDLAILDGLYSAGKLKVVIDSRFPLEQLAAAWERSMAGRAVGKIVIEVGADE